MASGGTTGATSGRDAALERMVEYAHRRHWVEQYHEEAKGLLGWDQYQGRLWPGFHRHAVQRDAGVQLPGLAGVAADGRSEPARDDRGGLFPPRPDRRRVSLPEVHRQICDWLRLEAAKELLSRELMSVPERAPA